MNYNTELEQLKNSLDELTSKVSSLKGQENLLSEQIGSSKENIQEYRTKRIVYKKSIEFLTIVQGATKEKIKKGFEQIVTYALRFIYSSDYKFELEFERIGNLQKLDFNIKTPDKQNPLNPMDTSGGGVLNILSLALRVSLLELIRPKLEGFLVLDEPFHNLSKEYMEQAHKFIEAINKKMGRQIILITHKSELLNSENNLIEIK